MANSSSSSLSSKCPFQGPIGRVEGKTLYSSLPARVEYLSHFLDFTPEDGDIINEYQFLFEPMIPDLVNQVYAKLFEYDFTKKVFVETEKRDHPSISPEEAAAITLDSEQLRIRKDFFSKYLYKTISLDYSDPKTWEYFDKVGIMHTGEAGLKHRKLVGKEGLKVDYMHLAVLIGWLFDNLAPVIILHQEIPPLEKVHLIRALNKVFTIQGILFSTHYVVHDITSAAPSSASHTSIAKQCPVSGASSGHNPHAAQSRTTLDQTSFIHWTDSPSTTASKPLPSLRRSISSDFDTPARSPQYPFEDYRPSSRRSNQFPRREVSPIQASGLDQRGYGGTVRVHGAKQDLNALREMQVDNKGVRRLFGKRK